MNEKIKEMLEMQKALDDYITKNNGITKIEKSRLQMALIDEIGELTHELKGDWCWWKKTQKPVDRNKVLEELVDVWHFALSYHNHFDGVLFRWLEKDYIEQRIYNMDVHDIISYLIIDNCYKLYRCVELTYKLGFEIDDVYKAYIEKNKENYERQKRGY